jgi:hypothetical protein
MELKKEEIEAEVQRWITENLKQFILVVGYRDDGVINLSLDTKFKEALSAHLSEWMLGQQEQET